MEKNIRKLPEELIYNIMSYTYEVQPSTLLHDIKNYYDTKIIVSEYYYRIFIVELGDEPTEDKNWIINDLYSFYNRYQPTMWGYCDNFYNVFYRNIRLNTRDNVQNYCKNLDKNSVDTQINIFWGLLNINERAEFIKKKLF